ncbi:hypothetical protein M436DRAFT_76654 [Aureobasidium namibiae CBS 147.97]|uniref:Rhodopsin domain-containing protein n=1 Tax=Aureobasidium namibiae CBS 147.97 TaxID=1043004 RepID=A0A074WAX1_9PEZI
MSTTPPTDEQLHHGSRAHQLILVTVIALVLPTIFVILRLLARHVLRIRLYFDDWLIIIAWFFKVGLDISGALLIKHGIGRPIQEVSLPDLIEIFKIQYTGVIQYPLCVLFTKLSILYQYRRLFPNHDFKLVTSVLIAITIMWCTAVMMTGIFMCTPISKAWSPMMKDGRCIALVPYYYGMQIPNVVTDLIILLMPFNEIRRLELSWKRKLGVGFASFLWVISLVCGVVRLAVMVQFGAKGKDITWNLIPPAIWTTIEPAVQISTACLPALRVLYRKYMDHRREKAKYAAHDRLRALELTSPADGTSGDGNATTTTSDSLYGSTTQGSWTTKDHSQREGVVERDVYV